MFRIMRSKLPAPLLYTFRPSRRSMHMDSSTDEELFSVTTWRWLYNEKKQRAIRHVPFNVQAFLNVAVQAAGANECISFKKVEEGTLNRVFLLKFDNEIEFIAKIPFPVAGPKHFCTASEVATMDFIRTELGIPAPNVLAWNSRAENSPVGAEYIMYERIPGVELYQHDEANLPLGNDPYVDILPDIQHIHSQFMTRAFSQIGNIYYKEDVPEPLRDRPLYAKDHVTTNSTRFCIGPTTDREFWRAGRASLDIDRGPWPNTHSYLLALAACARAFVDAHLDSSIRDSYRRLISDYEKLAPHIAPLQSLYMLWHPDLHAGNIIVTETTSPCKLMSIIEWENAHVAPFYLQIAPAPAYTYDEAEDEDETLPVDPPSRGDSELPGQTDVLDNNRKLRRYRSYKAILHENDPPLAKEMFDLLGVWQKRHLLSPAEAITRGDIGGLALIGQGFLICRGLWGSMVGFNEKREPLLPFPIDISKKKEERLEKEWASSLFRRNALTCNDMLEPLNMSWYREGMVSIDEYEDVKRGVEAKRQEILDAAENPEEKLRLEQEWPLQDGKVAMSADICC